ncbi:hypothetical protein K1719_003736 [Acacia pycnantha]|nr:hypothetical protein K1719_003736 [Acacia pycnantha]
MDLRSCDKSSPPRPRRRKVAYGGMQTGYGDNYTDESFLEGMVTNASVVKRDMIKVIVEKLSEDEIAGMKEMFRVLDTDNSGHITREELKVGLEKVGAFLKDSEINRLMQSADADNSGTIDYGEFLAAMLHENKLQEKIYILPSPILTKMLTRIMTGALITMSLMQDSSL